MKEIKAQAERTHNARFGHLGLKNTSKHPGYASGGSVHSDAAQDRAMVKSMVKPDALNRARGGRAKKAATNINIIVGKDGAAAPQPMPIPMPVPPPGGMPPGGPMAGAGKPPMPVPPPGGMPPGIGGVAGPRKRGGRV